MVITEANLLSFLILILFAKLLLTSICIGFGLFGGVFSPSLFLGAVVGAIIFHVPFLGIDETVLSIFAVAGMAAVASSVIGAPISAVIFPLQSYPCSGYSQLPSAIFTLGLKLQASESIQPIVQFPKALTNLALFEFLPFE